MADSSLLVLLDEVRGKTIRLLNATPEADARWAPPGLQNTITWHGGHAYILLECLTMRAIGKAPQVPDGWFAMFSWESRPDRVPADHWPALVAVIEQLEGQHERMRRLINKLTHSPPGPAVGPPSRRDRAPRDRSCAARRGLPLRRDSPAPETAGRRQAAGGMTRTMRNRPLPRCRPSVRSAQRLSRRVFVGCSVSTDPAYFAEFGAHRAPYETADEASGTDSHSLKSILRSLLARCL